MSTDELPQRLAAYDRSLAVTDQAADEPVPQLRSVCHLNQTDLARRWRISPRTLERWRWLKQGPVYLKLGGRVAYRTQDIEAFEAAQTHCHAPLADPMGSGV